MTREQLGLLLQYINTKVRAQSERNPEFAYRLTDKLVGIIKKLEDTTHV